MLRYLLIAMLTVGLLAGGCASPESQTEGAGNERRAEKPVEPSGEGMSEQQDPEPSEKRETTETSGPSEPDEDPGSHSEPQASPQDVLASQYRHLNASNYGAAYDLFDAGSRQLVSLEQYSAYFVEAAPYELTSYAFLSSQTEGDTASVVVDLTVSSSDGQEQYQATQQFVREDGGWRVVMRDEQVVSFSGSSAGSTTSSDASASANGASSPADPVGDFDASATVSQVVDGDTIEISPAIDGVEDVRLIGIDTPEAVDPNEEVEPLGPEASSFTTESLEGKDVGLEFDVEKEDQYDRLLAYVYVGREMFNEVLVEEGYAQTYPYEPNTKYEERLEAAQEDARAAGSGIWGLTNAEQCQLADRGNGIGEGTPGCSASVSATPGASGTASSSSASSSPSAEANEPAGSAVSPISEVDCPPSAPIKGNGSSGIYHVPGGDYYDETNPEECFAAPQDAEAAGYRASEV